MKWHGLNINIETERGQRRNGVTNNGKSWIGPRLPCSYGEIAGTEGADGDHVDVYIGPDHHSGKVYVVDQVDAKTGKWDEHKAMLSYGSKEAALSDYKRAFSDGKGQDRIGSVTEMSVSEFKNWLKSGDTKKPLGRASGGSVGEWRETSMTSDGVNPPRVAMKSGSFEAPYAKGGSIDGDGSMNAVSKGLEAARRAKRRARYASGGGVDEPLNLPRVSDPTDRVLNDDVLPPVSRLSKQRPKQKLAPDWDEKLLSLAASVPDVFRIPSAAVGMVSPETRDAWRAIEDRHPGMSFAGSVLGGGGAMKALGGLGVLGGATSGAASDVIDSAAGKEGAISNATAAKAILGGAAGLPLRYAVPAASTAGTLLVPDSAAAQTMGVRERLQAMPRDELMAYQRMIGVTPDGRIGPDTISKAIAYEAQVRARADNEANNIRAAGDAEAKKIEAEVRAKALAGAEAEIAKNKAASELQASEAQRPFLQNNPGYAKYAPYVAGALAAAVPAAGALLSRRAATAPVRQQARTIDSAIKRFESNPTPLNARTVAEATTPVPEAAPLSNLEKALDYGSIGLGAAMPSAAVVAPYFVDYMQAPDTEAHKVAAQQFTVPKLVERMTGPFALGMTLAGAGRFVGERGGNAYINPAPRGANAAQAAAIKKIVDAAPDDAALAESLKVASGRDAPSFLENVATLPGRLSKSYNNSMADAGDAKARALNVARDVQGLRQSSRGEQQQLGSGSQLLDEAATLEGAATPRSSGPSAASGAVDPKTIEPTPIRKPMTVYSGLPEGRPPTPEVLPNPALEAPRTNHYRYRDRLGRLVHKDEVTHRFVPDPRKPQDTSEKVQPRKGNVAGTKTLQVEGPKDPVVKEPVPRGKVERTAEEDLADPSKMRRGQKDGGVSRAMGGAIDRALSLAGRYASGGNVHVGAVVGDTGGRSDDLPVSVPAGAFVVPADVVSALGEGNSLAGCKNLDRMFKTDRDHMAAGGQAIPIKISDGEYVISPSAVAKIGNGDMDMGHRTLDKFVLGVRKQHINQLKSLPPPAR